MLSQGRRARYYFFGKYTVTLDDKGRFAVPAEIRYKLLPEDHETFIIIPSGDHYLIAFPALEWYHFVEKIQAQPNVENISEVFAVLMSQAVECPMDGQGRIRLPASLISEFNFDRELLITSVGNHFRIWRSEDYYNYLKRARENVLPNLGKLTDLSLRLSPLVGISSGYHTSPPAPDLPDDQDRTRFSSSSEQGG